MSDPKQMVPKDVVMDLHRGLVTADEQQALMESG